MATITKRTWTSRAPLGHKLKGIAYGYGLGVLVVVLSTATSAFGESTAEMASFCRPVVDGEIKSATIGFVQNYRSGVCWGAFAVLQRTTAQGFLDGRMFFSVCAPPESTRSQLVTVFVEYSRRNPQRLHEDFFDVALDALKEAFPCSKR